MFQSNIGSIRFVLKFEREFEFKNTSLAILKSLHILLSGASILCYTVYPEQTDT